MLLVYSFHQQNVCTIGIYMHMYMYMYMYVYIPIYIYIIHFFMPKEYAARLKPMVCDTITLINNAIKNRKKIVVEGANACMLDIDFGKPLLPYYVYMHVHVFVVP